ncbi:hypothetical protein [Streptomyces sp. NPDC018031]|uniref:hypothetical protein n=1 Tax=Streptomyces sp. NPDC018031 TaxID=3365033 RepID=UPI00378B5CF1
MDTGNRRARRTMRAAAVLLAAAAVAGATGGCDDGGSGEPSASASKRPGAAAGDQAGRQRAQQALEGFLTSYQQALNGEGVFTKEALRDQNLTPRYVPRLVEWEKENHVDGVFRTKDVPLSWTTRVIGEKSTGDSAFVEATFEWGTGKKTAVEYEYDVRTLKIRGIEAK